MPAKGWKKASSVGVPTPSTRANDMYWNGYQWLYSKHVRCVDKSHQLPAIIYDVVFVEGESLYIDAFMNDCFMCVRAYHHE